jgi:adenylate kinase
MMYSPSFPTVPSAARDALDLLRDVLVRCAAAGELCVDTGVHRVPYIDRGELVPNEIVLDIVRETHIAAKENGGGYVFDGAPRTLDQARAGYKLVGELGMTANIALHLQADDEELTRRLIARAAVAGRTDDTDAVTRQRLALYHPVTQPVVDWYARRSILVSVDAMRPAAEVGREILAALEAMRPLLDHVPDELRRPIDLTGLDARLRWSVGPVLQLPGTRVPPSSTDSSTAPGSTPE